jgi:hypothetical protein
MEGSAEPRLAPAGAGLPKAELAVARVLFGWRRLRGSAEQFIASFQMERERIRHLVESHSAEEASKRVLIERVRGLEDSSRYWSVWMTLEHLRIVHEGLARIISDLARGVAPPGVVSTAAVKPKEDVDAAVVRVYEKSCDMVLAAAKGAPNLKSGVRHTHPWFGPLDAHGWLALAAGHLRIHRVQIERILGVQNRG